MTPEVFSWDDASDNRFLASGIACWVHDAISAYRTTESTNPPVFKNTFIALRAGGAARQAGQRVPRPSSGWCWKFSKNQPAVKEFLAHLVDNDKEGMVQSTGYNMPFLNDNAKKPMPSSAPTRRCRSSRTSRRSSRSSAIRGRTHRRSRKWSTCSCFPISSRRSRVGRSVDEIAEVGGRRVPADLLQVQARMTVSLGGRRRGVGDSRGRPVGRSAEQSSRVVAEPRPAAPGVRLPAAGAGRRSTCSCSSASPFLFSLYLAVSDANVGDPVATFVGLENFRAALESDVFWIALRNSVVFLVVAAVFKSLLGTSLAFLLLQNFKGKKLVRGLVVIPFTLPISVSVLSWKWMYDSQFSVINWVPARLGLIGGYGSPSWPIWLGQPHLALARLHRRQRLARHSRSRRSSCSRGSRRCPRKCSTPPGSTAARFFQRFRHVVDADDLPDPHHRLPVRHGVHAVRPERRVPADPGRSGQLDARSCPCSPTRSASRRAASAGARRSRSSSCRSSSPLLFLMLRNLRRREW